MARRVNKRFLVVFGAIVVVGLAAAVVLGWQIRGARKRDQAIAMAATADRLLVEADQLRAQAADTDKVTPEERERLLTERRVKMMDAASNLDLAVNADPKNADLCIRLGDVLNRLAVVEFGYLGKARQKWVQALEADPDHPNIRALRRLMESYYQEAQVRPSAAVFGQVMDRAQTIHQIKPDDLRATAQQNIAPLNQSLLNIETPTDRIDTAIRELSALVTAHPDDPAAAEWLFWAAEATAKQGSEARRVNQDQLANDKFKAAVTMFEDALKAPAQDANAWMHYRFFELLYYVKMEDRERDNTQRYTDKMKREVDRAYELAIARAKAAAQQPAPPAAAAGAEPEAALDAREAQRLLDDQLVKICIGAHEWANQYRD